MIDSDNIKNALKWLDKFRKRIIVMLIIPLIFAAGVYFISDEILRVISVPLMGEPLFFITPTEGIVAKLKLAFFGGLILSVPFIECFIISMLPLIVSKSVKRKLYFIIVPFSTMCLAGGILFGYKYILGTTVKLLLSTGEGIMDSMISGSSYVSFVTFFLLTIGAVFQLPLLLVALSRIGIVSSNILMKKRKIAILITVIALAILTPTPDAFTLVAVSLPVILLYEISIWWIFILERVDRKKVKIDIAIEE